jgi:hypothetical protein
MERSEREGTDPDEELRAAVGRTVIEVSPPGLISVKLPTLLVGKTMGMTGPSVPGRTMAPIKVSNRLPCPDSCGRYLGAP